MMMHRYKALTFMQHSLGRNSLTVLLYPRIIQIQLYTLVIRMKITDFEGISGRRDIFTEAHV